MEQHCAKQELMVALACVNWDKP